MIPPPQGETFQYSAWCVCFGGLSVSHDQVSVAFSLSIYVLYPVLFLTSSLLLLCLSERHLICFFAIFKMVLRNAFGSNSIGPFRVRAM